MYFLTIYSGWPWGCLPNTSMAYPVAWTRTPDGPLVYGYRIQVDNRGRVHRRTKRPQMIWPSEIIGEWRGWPNERSRQRARKAVGIHDEHNPPLDRYQRQGQEMERYATLARSLRKRHR